MGVNSYRSLKRTRIKTSPSKQSATLRSNRSDEGETARTIPVMGVSSIGSNRESTLSPRKSADGSTHESRAWLYHTAMIQTIIYATTLTMLWAALTTSTKKLPCRLIRKINPKSSIVQNLCYAFVFSSNKWHFQFLFKIYLFIEFEVKTITKAHLNEKKDYQKRWIENVQQCSAGCLFCWCFGRCSCRSGGGGCCRRCCRCELVGFFQVALILSAPALANFLAAFFTAFVASFVNKAFWEGRAAPNIR